MRSVIVAVLLALILHIAPVATQQGGQATATDVPGPPLPAPRFGPFGNLPPLRFGLGFPGGWELAYEVTTPVVRGLDLPRGLTPGDDGWANFTLPAPLQVDFAASFYAVNSAGEETSRRADVKFLADNVRVALRMRTANSSPGGCISLDEALVEVGNFSRTVSCSGSGGLEGGECSAGERSGLGGARAIEEAIGETIVSSPQVARFDRQGSRECAPTGAAYPPYPQVVAGALESVPAPPPSPNTDNTTAKPERLEQEEAFYSIAGTVLGTVVLAVVTAVLCCGCCMGCCCWRGARESAEDKAFLDQCRPLVLSPTLPLWVRIAFYAVVAGNVGFFVSANVSVGATINVDYIIEGVFIKNPAFYDFSFLVTAIELMKAGIYLLGVVLLGFSVIWPYVKLLCMTAMFSVPSSWVRPRRREGILQWLDALGKWSMFDVFALSGCMALFYIEILSPAVGSLYPLGYYGIVLSMTPMWGMFANLIAQIISQLLSMFTLWAHSRGYVRDWHKFHRSSVTPVALPVADAVEPGDIVDGLQKPDNSAPEASGGLPVLPDMPAVAVMSQEFCGAGMRQKATAWGKALTIIGILVTIALVICGSILTGFTFRVVGLLGLVQDIAVPGSSTRFFTPFSMVSEMIRSVAEAGIGLQIGTWLLAIVMIACVLFVPVCQAAVLLAIWAVPMPLTTLKAMLKANEILASWQYMEVYLIAVIVGGIQIPMLADLLVGDSCDGIQDLLDWMVEKGIMTHATCFSADIRVKAGLWCIFIGSILLYTCSVAVREAAFEIVGAYDPFAAAQGRPLTVHQYSYYSKRARALNSLRLIEFCGKPYDGLHLAKV